MTVGGVSVSIDGLPQDSPLVLAYSTSIQADLALRLRELLPGDTPWDRSTLEAAAEAVGLPLALAQQVLAVDSGSVPLSGLDTGESDLASTRALAVSLLDGDLSRFRERLLPLALRRLLRLHSEWGDELTDWRTSTGLVLDPVLEELRARLEERDPVEEPDFVRDGMITHRKKLRPLFARCWFECPERLGRSVADELASELLLDLARAPAERHAKAITELRGAHARGRRGSALTQLARRLLGPERERPELGDEPFLEGLTTEVVQRNREAARRGSAWRVCVVHVEVLATLRALATTVAAPLDEGSSAAEVARSFAEGVLDAPHGLSVEADIPEGGPLLECLQQSLRALWAALPASTWAVLWAHPPP